MAPSPKRQRPGHSPRIGAGLASGQERTRRAPNDTHVKTVARPFLKDRLGIGPGKATDLGAELFSVEHPMAGYTKKQHWDLLVVARGGPQFRPLSGVESGHPPLASTKRA